MREAKRERRHLELLDQKSASKLRAMEKSNDGIFEARRPRKGYLIHLCTHCKLFGI